MCALSICVSTFLTIIKGKTANLHESEVQVQKNWQGQDSTFCFISFRITFNTKQCPFLKQLTGIVILSLRATLLLLVILCIVFNTPETVAQLESALETAPGCLLLPKKNNHFLCFQLYITINLKRYISFQATSWLTLKEDSELLPWTHMVYFVGNYCQGKQNA